jgi:hypothetical protein
MFAFGYYLLERAPRWGCVPVGFARLLVAKPWGFAACQWVCFNPGWGTLFSLGFGVLAVSPSALEPAIRSLSASSAVLTLPAFGLFPLFSCQTPGNTKTEGMGDSDEPVWLASHPLCSVCLMYYTYYMVVLSGSQRKREYGSSVE